MFRQFNNIRHVICEEPIMKKKTALYNESGYNENGSILSDKLTVSLINLSDSHPTMFAKLFG